MDIAFGDMGDVAEASDETATGGSQQAVNTLAQVRILRLYRETMHRKHAHSCSRVLGRDHDLRCPPSVPSAVVWLRSGAAHAKDYPVAAHRSLDEDELARAPA